MKEQERDAFEAWLSGFDIGSEFDLDDEGYYDDFNVQRAWAAWQARAALAANVPTGFVPEHVLRNVLATLTALNEKPNGPIRDTLWYSDYETLFDYIENMLAEHAPFAPKAMQCVDLFCACRGGPCAECPEGQAIADEYLKAAYERKENKQ